MEVNGANCELHDGPRELEIFSDEQVEEVMESLEYFKGKIEQLQAYCEQVNQNKMQVDENLMEQKRKHHEELEKYQEEISSLRNANIQLMAGKIASTEKRGNFSVSALSCAIDAESAEARIQDITSKVRGLELTLAEKDKHISVMEWQIVDLESTIATLEAERDQLVLELELRHPHENIVQDHDPIGDIGGDEDGHSGHPEAHRKQRSTNSRRCYSDLWANGNESLSLRQMLSLSAEWSVKDSAARMRKPPQRHSSDRVKRDGRGRGTDFSRPNATHSLEDFDNLSEVDSGLGLGKLTRTTNFCDILDADEYSNIHVADNRLSFTADSLAVEPCDENGSPLQPLSKKWATFENGLGSSVEEDILGSEEKIENSQNSEISNGGNEFPKTNGENASLGSSTSDFSSAFHSSQDVLVSSTEEAWACSTVSVSESAPAEAEKKKLSKKAISKSDSCIIPSRSKSPPTEKDDMWNFTPDSIVNVSTGEILIPSVVETPPSPSLKKSRSFTSSIAMVLQSPRSPVTSQDSTESEERTVMDNVEQTMDSVDNTKSHTSETVKLRRKSESGATPRAKHHQKSKSACDETPSKENTQGLESRHTKSLSDPIKKADEKRGRRKLMEYQKWQKYGRRGKPPGDLKISDC